MHTRTGRNAGDVRLEAIPAVGAALDELRARGRGRGGLALRAHRLVSADQVPVVDEGFAVLPGDFGEGTPAGLAVGVQGADALLGLRLEGAAEIRSAGNGFFEGTDLSLWSSTDLEAVATAINNRPRKILGWRTLAEVFEEQLRSLQQPGVATIN